MNQDLNSTLEDFRLLKKTFLEEQQCNLELRAAIENLQKQNKYVNDTLKLESRKCSSEQETALKEQKANALILELKGENMKLRKHVKDLEAITLDLKTEKAKLEKHNVELKLSSSKELEDLKTNYETKIKKIENELNKQLLEFQRKLDEGASDKREEIDILILDYEEKLQKLEERLIAKENENMDIQKKAAADVAIYQKKMLALEHLCNELQKQQQEAMAPSSESVMRHQQQLPTSTSTKNDQTSSGDRGFQYHQPRTFRPSSSACSSSAFLCSPADFQPDTTTATPAQNKQTRGRSRPNISKRNISDANNREDLCKNSSDTINIVQETSIISKTTRFSMAKKRRLFSNNQNIL